MSTTHGGARGKRKERLYRIWKQMHARCKNPRLPFAHRYVLRGIRVCDEWADYAVFRGWANAAGYTDELSLDRIDNDGNYEPNNCRWSDNIMQANNTSRNHYITIAGQRMSLAEAQRRYGVSASAYGKRRRRGWSPERALTTPPMKNQHAER